MPFSLRRKSDRAGDSGQMSLVFRCLDDGSVEKREEPFPVVGWQIRVGSMFARSYSAQDWWQTSPVTEILEDRTEGEKRTIRFKTRSSEYEWIAF